MSEKAYSFLESMPYKALEHHLALTEHSDVAYDTLEKKFIKKRLTTEDMLDIMFGITASVFDDSLFTSIKPL